MVLWLKLNIYVLQIFTDFSFLIKSNKRLDFLFSYLLYYWLHDFIKWKYIEDLIWVVISYEIYETSLWQFHKFHEMTIYHMTILNWILLPLKLTIVEQKMHGWHGCHHDVTCSCESVM